MKLELKTLSMLLLLLMCLMTACSDEDAKQISLSHNEKELTLASQLADLNDSLFMSILLTRGDPPKQDTTKTDIVGADCIGAAIGVLAGICVPGEVVVKASSSIICGIVGGAVNSICEAVSGGYVVASIGNEDSPIRYINVIQHYAEIDSTQINSLYKKSPLLIPKNYAWAEKVGIMHNLMLERLLDEDVKTKANNSVEFNTIYTKFKEGNYYNLLSQCEDWQKTLQNEDNEDIWTVMKSFMSIYSLCISNNDKKNALLVQEAYIDFVNKELEIREQEKIALYAGFSVAWYSFNYWSKRLNW